MEVSVSEIRKESVVMEILRELAEGRAVTVTRRGKPVGKLTPCTPKKGNGK